MTVSLNLEIITPYGRAWKGEADLISFRTVSGSMAFLPERAPAIFELSVNEMTIRSGQEEQTFAIHGGYILNTRDKVVVMTDAAEKPEDIIIQRAEERLQRAKELMEISQSNRERARISGKLQRHMLRIRMSKKS